MVNEWLLISSYFGWIFQFINRVLQIKVQRSSTIYIEKSIKPWNAQVGATCLYLTCAKNLAQISQNEKESSIYHLEFLCDQGRFKAWSNLIAVMELHQNGLTLIL